MKDDLSDGQSPGGLSYDELQGVLNELADYKDAVNEANGRLRAAIKAVLDEHGIHKGALATIRQIEGMSETARADYLRSFEPMFDAMLSHRWRDEQANLLDQLEGDG